MNQRTLVMLAALALGSAAAPAVRADIVIGGVVSATGPTASLGVPQRNAFALLPKTIGGEPVTYVVRDDSADPTNTVTILRKLITEDKVDVIIGPGITGTAAAALDVVNQAKVPNIALAPVAFDPAKFPWSFAVPQPVPLMVQGAVEHMKANGVKSVAYIGFADGWGEQVENALVQLAEQSGLNIVARERYARTDTSVQAQVLRVMAKRADAVMLGGAGTPGALPHITLSERKYAGRIYNNHGVVNRDYIRVGGQSVDGEIAPTGPLVVYDQLPASHPTKRVAEDFMKRYGEAYGPENRNAFAGYTYDAFLLIERAAQEALKKAKPGTPEFRSALRDAIENTKEVVGTHGVYSMNAGNHVGLDARARVLVRIENGAWKLIQ